MEGYILPPYAQHFRRELLHSSAFGRELAARLGAIADDVDRAAAARH